MKTIGKLNQENQKIVINKDVFPPDVFQADTVEKRIFLRMADLNITTNDIPAVLKEFMVFTNYENGVSVAFSDSSYGLHKSLKAVVLYLVSLFLKTDPSIFYYGKQKGFDTLKPDPDFVHMDLDSLNGIIKGCMDLNDVAGRLKKIRREEQMTVAETAAILGVSPATVFNYENPEKRKKIRLTITQLFSFSEKCDITPDLIMLGDEFNTIIELTKSGITQPRVLRTISADTKDRMVAHIRAKNATVDEILECRQWIVDNIGKVEPLNLFAIKRMIQSEIKQKQNIVESETYNEE